MLDTKKVMDLLNEHGEIRKLKELEHVTVFKGIRNNSKDEPKEITVHISDRGEKEKFRYRCMVEYDNGKSVAGNPQETIEDAILCLHWFDLD